MKRIAKSVIAAALSSAAACMLTTSAMAAPADAANATPEELLRPYFARLERTSNLPQANTAKPLDKAQTLTRLAFGSCNHQSRSQKAWQVIADTSPQLFLVIGDNVYGDYGYHGEADLGSFRAAYALQASHPEFRAFRSAVPMTAVWDDHDFGPNDAGGAFAFREFSETLFETFWRSSEDVRSRPGVYDSITMGPDGRRVQVILLDTRFFRSPLKSLPYQDPRPPLGSYVADDSPEGQMLGEAQWQWLETKLKEPAELRIIVSSIQVLTDAHGFEKWGNLPRERDRLYRLLSGRNGGGTVLLSGDRHSGGIYRARPEGLDEEIWEITSSSLNLAFGGGDASAREPDPLRQTRLVADENYGLVDIDWASRKMTLRLMDTKGGQFVYQTVDF